MAQNEIYATVILVGYYAAFAAALGLLARGFKLPREWLRKAYHMCCGVSVFILIFAFDLWYAAVFAVTLMLMSGYVLLLAGDRIPMATVSIDRGKGMSEIREHLLLMLLSMVVLLAVLWGWLGDGARFAVAVGLLAWGFGDAAASLVGGRFGQRRFNAAIFDPQKSPLGSVAMMAASAVVIFPVLLGMTPLTTLAALLCAGLLGVLAAFTEAVTRRGLDTLTVPVVTGLVSYPLVQFVGQQGGGHW